MNWFEVLDIQRSLANCHQDMLGDWFRDPWGWAELSWAVERAPELVEDRLNAAGASRAAPIDVPKENFTTRPAVVLDPLDRLVYQALVDRVSRRIGSDLRPWVFGWRLPRAEARDGHYSPNKTEWRLHRGRLVTLAERFNAVLVTDIVSCFASIPIERVVEEVGRRSRNGSVSGRLRGMLTDWERIPGRSGLPQRSMASAVLANMYLSPLDLAIDEAALRTRGDRWGSAARWMDDIWIFANQPSHLRHSQRNLEMTMRDLGLHMNGGKTAVLEGDEVIEAANEMEHSGVDQGLAQDPPETDNLEELVSQISTRPEAASKTTVRFITTRIRNHRLWSFVDTFTDLAERMPHCADSLARLFRDSGSWQDLTGWYLQYVQSEWNVAWAAAQLGTMFPTTNPGQTPLQVHLAEEVSRHAPLEVTALATQRLSVWNPDRARQVIRATIRSSTHPLERRVLALAAATAGEERQFIRTALGEFPENRVTLRMLEDRDYRPPPFSADYAG
jgi:Reverse transcriptase (RNA-dependent DNA polymerase)